MKLKIRPVFTKDDNKEVTSFEGNSTIKWALVPP